MKKSAKITNKTNVTEKVAYMENKSQVSKVKMKNFKMRKKHTHRDTRRKSKQ